MTEQRSNTTEPTSVRVASRLTMLLLALSAVFAAVLLVRGVIGAINGEGEVSFRGSVSVTEDDTRMPSFVDKPGVADVTVHIRQADAKQQLLVLARDLTPVVLIALGLWLLLKVLMSVRSGEPFSQPNVRRLRGMGWLLIIAAPAVLIAQHYIDNELASTVPGLRQWPDGGDLPLFNGPVAGLVVLVLAEVFAYGVRLREDLEGPV
jgi:hypothetical protein